MAKVSKEEVDEVLDDLTDDKIFMKDEESLSTLAAISILCTSKAKVITQDRPCISQLWKDGNKEEVIICEDNNEGCKQVEEWSCLEQAAALCSDAEFAEDQDDISSMVRRETTGNTIDASIFKYMLFISGEKVMEYRANNEKVAQIPFNSASKFHLSIHQTENGNRIVMKGAPEKILEKCSTILLIGVDNPKDEQIVNTIEEAIKELAACGERVIGFCDMLLPKDEFPDGYRFDTDEINFPMQDFRFLGLMSFVDPLRASAPDVIASLGRKVGDKIKVVIITGDHPETTKAVARSTGIIGMDTKILDDCKDTEEDAGAAIVLGTDLKELSEDALGEILQKYPEVVFARTSPHQKMVIVKAYQKLGHKVAVTGSQLNDVPALKSADLGIAVGWQINEDAKNAADMVITDGNSILSCILNAVDKARDLFKSAN